MKVISVDGNMCNWEFADTPYRLEPGPHHVVATVNGASVPGFHDFLFEVKPGRHYQIHAHEEDDVVRIWIEDIAAKSAVGKITIEKTE